MAERGFEHPVRPFEIVPPSGSTATDTASLVDATAAKQRYAQTNAEKPRGSTSIILIQLSDEIDKNLRIQHQTCLAQQRLIREMQARRTALKVRVPDRYGHSETSQGRSEGSPESRRGISKPYGAIVYVSRPRSLAV